MAKFKGNRCIPTAEGKWDKTKEYLGLSVVLDEKTGDSYTSKKVVPAGTELTNKDYWALSGQYNAQMALIKLQLEAMQNIPEGGTTADAALANIRIGADGTEYATPGDAVRGQVAALSEEIAGITEAAEMIPIEIKNGYYGNDAWTDSTTYTTKIYDVSELSKVKVYAEITPYINKYTCLMSDGNIVSYERNNGPTKVIYDTELNATNVDMIAIGCNNNQLTTMSVKKNIPKLDDALVNVSLNGVDILGFYHDGVKNITATYASVSYDVVQGDFITIKMNADSWFDTYTFLDISENVISYYRGDSGNIERNVVAPKNATKMIVGTSVVNHATICVMAKKVFDINEWTGKKILWFGTSIPAGGFIGKTLKSTYPRMVGDKLGAYVVNEAIGSSAVHCKQPNRVYKDTNPYGFIGNFEACSRCLTNTIAEMQWIIDNYNSNIWTSGTVSSMNDTLKNQILSCSYENKLNQHLTTTTIPDLIVFDHGHNDLINALDLEHQYYEQYGEDSLYTFRGAMNFLIKKIKNFNSRIQIVVVGEYCGNENNQINTMQIEVAKDWNIPIYKQWEMLGWSKTKEISKKGYWNKNSSGLWEWISDATYRKITIFNSWIPDTIHPHTDSSGRALIKMSNGLCNWLMNTIAYTDIN